MTVTTGDGKTRSFDRGITLAEAIKAFNFKSDNRIVAAKLDGRVTDLIEILQDDTTLHVLTCNDAEGLPVFWHSASHVMAQAVKMLHPEALLGIGPSIANGFYYDFHLDSTLSIDDFPAIEKKINEIVESDQPFIRIILSKDEALALFQEKGERFKCELIQALPDEQVTVYENGDFIDLCRGPHVPSTGFISHFKLLSVAGAYWHGDERNPVMQRIYGIAFCTAKLLDDHLKAIEEAQKRDHRRLAKELDLFSFQPEGPGFPFWHPNGMIVHHEASQYMRETLIRHGYSEIKTPLILSEELWHRSGHWDNYKNNMYFTSIDDQAYAVKPMNCPGALLVYKNAPHSYRDLPLKLSEMGLVHRHEKSGVLHGLFRVRQFTQDDAHVFCTPEQMEDEIIKLIDLVEEVYHTFGFNRFLLELSTRPNQSIGTAAMWEKAEKALMNALERKKAIYQVNPGEGAFYGPKIDYHIEDSLGRLWQCGTIQVDFSMPERFDLEYVGSDGEKHRPVMIHRAILGSVERFIGILIEHVGGAFPVWLAPVQCAVLPISEKHHDYAQEIFQILTEAQIRCKIDDRNEKMGYKIREAETKKIPYMCIVGDREIDERTVSVRKRKKGDLGSKSLQDFVTQIQDEIKRRIGYQEG
ncbi:MAG: threonine--tRNA ligase [bacterium]